MAHSDRWLAQDERIVLDLRPHAGKALAVPAAVLVLVGGLTGFVAGRVPEGASQGVLRLVVAATGLALVLALCGRPFVRWLTTHYVLTDRRVLLRRGVLARSGRDVPLSRVVDVHFSRSLLERLLGCGSVVLEHSGERGQVVLPDVPQVELVQRTLYELVERADERRPV